MVKRPESVHFHKPTAQTIYISLLIGGIAVLTLFLYVSYLAYTFITETPFLYSSYFVVSLISVAIFLLALLIIIGKAGYKELTHLKKYKHVVRHSIE